MLARLGDNYKCQEPWVPFLATLKFIQMVQSSVLLCWGKKWEEGNEAWQAHWKENRFLWTNREAIEKQSTGGRNTSSKRPTKRPPLDTALYYIYKSCRCTHSLGNNCLYRENGKYFITITRNPSSSNINHQSMEKTSNKIQHHGYSGTI